MRVVKEGARQGHHVRLAFGDDGFGLLCGRDHADVAKPLPVARRQKASASHAGMLDRLSI